MDIDGISPRMLESGFYNMDCMDGMAQFPDKFFDLCLTDPPYGVNLPYNTYNDTEENWYKLMTRAVPEMIRVSKMAIFPSCQIKRLGWFYANFPPDWIMCWNKGSTGCAGHIGFNDWEPLLVYGKSKSNLFMHDVINITPNEKMGNHNHPCPKPLSWAKWIISRATAKGDKVIDPFTGSGTSAIACHQLQRQFWGFELDPDYFNAATERLNKVKAQVSMTELIEQVIPEQATIGGEYGH